MTDWFVLSLHSIASSDEDKASGDEGLPDEDSDVSVTATKGLWVGGNAGGL